MMPAFCIAYEEDGAICRRLATRIDEQRGGMVCRKHWPGNTETSEPPRPEASQADATKHDRA